MSKLKSESMVTRVKAEFKSLLGIALYFWVLFTLFAFHKAILYKEPNVLLPLGLALINSKLMAKVVFLGEHTTLSRPFEHRPLIYTILFKSFVFAILLFFFRVIEELLIGLWRGRSIHDILFIDHPLLEQGDALYAIAMVCTIMFVALIPFFAYREVEEALGVETLRGLLFKRTLAEFRNDRQSTGKLPDTPHPARALADVSTPDDDDYWYLDDRGETIGPLTRSQCQRALSDGVIDCSTMIWRRAFGDEWAPLRDILTVT
jgi:hypothetical protein